MAQTTYFVCNKYEDAYYRYNEESRKFFSSRAFKASPSSLTFSVNEEKYVCLDVGSFMSKLRNKEIAVGSVVVLTFVADDVMMSSLREYKINLIERG